MVGYAYATLEARNWVDLIDAHGKLHDVFVDPAARRSGVARALVVAAIEALRVAGAPRLILSTAAQNEAAQAFFRTLGFAPSMVEMMRLL